MDATLSELKDIRKVLMALWDLKPSRETLLELERITRKISEILEGQEVKE